MCIYSAQHFLSLNAAKTQVMWSGKGFKATNCTVTIGDTPVQPNTVIEMLGVTFDVALRSRPYLTSQVRAAKAIRGTIRRLAFHVPRGMLLKQVASALIAGKIGYGAAVAYPIRRSNDDPVDGQMRELQVVINDIARATLGTRRSARIKTEDLLLKSGLPSLNRLAAKAIAMETWKALTSGSENLLSRLLGEPGSSARQTRSALAMHLPPPLPEPARTLVWEGYRTWNNWQPLREAKSASMARRAASNFARTLPL